LGVGSEWRWDECLWCWLSVVAVLKCWCSNRLLVGFVVGFLLFVVVLEGWVSHNGQKSEACMQNTSMTVTAAVPIANC
jgi:hypothetical protein